MPIFWNGDVITRNQLIFVAFIFLFCPWPLIVLLFGGLFCFYWNEWDEDFYGITFDDLFELYLEHYEITDEEICQTLAEQEYNFTVELQYGLTDYEVANNKRLLKEHKQWLKDHPKGLPEDQIDKTKNPMDLFDVKNLPLTHLMIGTEKFEQLWFLIEYCLEDFEELNSLVVPENDLMIESFDYWYIQLWENDSVSLNNELIQSQFSNGKRSKDLLFHSKWFYRSHLDQWLYSLPFSEQNVYSLNEDHLLIKYLVKKKKKLKADKII